MAVEDQRSEESSREMEGLDSKEGRILQKLVQTFFFPRCYGAVAAAVGGGVKRVDFRRVMIVVKCCWLYSN